MARTRGKWLEERSDLNCFQLLDRIDMAQEKEDFVN